MIQSPTNIGATNRGVELSYQQSLWGGFGVVGNYTYTNGKADDGAAVVGSSRGTYNLEGYYEDERLSARLAYTYRSSFLAGLFNLARPSMCMAWATWQPRSATRSTSAIR